MATKFTENQHHEVKKAVLTYAHVGDGQMRDIGSGKTHEIELHTIEGPMTIQKHTSGSGTTSYNVHDIHDEFHKFEKFDKLLSFLRRYGERQGIDQAVLWNWRKGYYDEPDHKYNFYHFRLPIEKVFELDLMTGNPNVDPESYQNSSPSMQDLVNFVRERGGYMIGYVVPVASGRSDARITFDGIMVKTDSSDAIQFAGRTNPDEFSEKMIDGTTYYRMWWD